MLVIISDIHLGDGTCGMSISSAAFHLFTDRLKELARNASQRADGVYRPLGTIDILMLGDILDVLHSTLWLEKDQGQPGYVRPWTDFRLPEFPAKIREITRSILENNRESVASLKDLTSGTSVTVPPATPEGKMDERSPEIPVKVRLHYTVGNHDWYYHLPGPAFDKIRSEIIEALGLFNSPKPFPHDLRESNFLSTLLDSYEVIAQHGDIYDPFNYDKTHGRDASSLGDAVAVEIINRFPVEVQSKFGNDLPPSIVENLRQLVNVRPVLATPLWISSQLRQNNIPAAEQKKVKALWDEICDNFLKIKFVQAGDIPYNLNIVEGLETIIRLTDRVSFQTVDTLVAWIRNTFGSGEITFARHALREEAFLDRKARFVVYGHTHHYEVVPLDSFPGLHGPVNQMYMNSGTWHTYFDLAINMPEEQKFIPYQVLTYLTFYKDDERQGRRYETWSGTFSG